MKKKIGDYEFVDLGLPSGTLWATCNIGAKSPEGLGDFFAWGGTNTKCHYGYDNYEFFKERYRVGKTLKYIFSKYNIEDNKTVLEEADDAAFSKGGCRMPTRSEFDELRANCKWEWTAVNGVWGGKVTGKNGNSIFFPGNVYYGHSLPCDVCGYYWTSSMLAGNDVGAWCFWFSWDVHKMYYEPRCNGYPIRAVYRPEKKKLDLKKTEDDSSEYVDLGLPGGTLWATCNIGAKSPEEYGDYFAWGEIEPKDDYSKETYKYYNDGKLTKYNKRGKAELKLEDDAAHANLGEGWSVPTSKQISELLDYCVVERTKYNDVDGFRVTGYNGKTLFFPAAGYICGRNLYKVGSEGSCWSNSLYVNELYHAWYLDLDFLFAYQTRYDILCVSCNLICGTPVTMVEPCEQYEQRNRCMGKDAVSVWWVAISLVLLAIGVRLYNYYQDKMEYDVAETYKDPFPDIPLDECGTQAEINHYYWKRAEMFGDSVMEAFDTFMRGCENPSTYKVEKTLWERYNSAALEAYYHINMGGCSGSAALMGYNEFAYDVEDQFLVSFSYSGQKHKLVTADMVADEYDGFLEYGIAAITDEEDTVDGEYSVKEKQDYLRAEKRCWELWMRYRNSVSAELEGDLKDKYDLCSNELRRMKLIQLKNQYQWYGIWDDDAYDIMLDPECTDEEIDGYGRFDLKVS